MKRIFNIQGPFFNYLSFLIYDVSEEFYKEKKLNLDKINIVFEKSKNQEFIYNSYTNIKDFILNFTGIKIELRFKKLELEYEGNIKIFLCLRVLKKENILLKNTNYKEIIELLKDIENINSDYDYLLNIDTIRNSISKFKTQ